MTTKITKSFTLHANQHSAKPSAMHVDVIVYKCKKADSGLLRSDFRFYKHKVGSESDIEFIIHGVSMQEMHNFWTQIETFVDKVSSIVAEDGELV